jgi:RHS repeat-associated protein
VLDDSDYYPFGGQRAVTSTSGNTYKFTGKERDTESGLDYFGERYYGSSMGRFMSADPVIITRERLANPQQLNLYAYVANNPLRYIDPTGAILVASGNQQNDYNDLCKIAGDACADRLKIDAKTGNVTFDTKDLDLSKNEGAKLVNDLVSSQNTYEFSEGPTVNTDKGPVKIDYIIANLPVFGDQRGGGQPRSGVSDVVGLNFDNKNVTRVSNTNLGVSLNFTIAFHELAEAYEKIDGGHGGSYEAGHNAALQRELTLRDQRPYLKQNNTGAGGPANSPHPEGGIIIKK